MIMGRTSTQRLSDKLWKNTERCNHPHHKELKICRMPYLKKPSANTCAPIVCPERCAPASISIGPCARTFLTTRRSSRPESCRCRSCATAEHTAEAAACQPSNHGAEWQPTYAEALRRTAVTGYQKSVPSGWLSSCLLFSGKS